MNTNYGRVPGGWNEFFDLFRIHDKLIGGNWFTYTLQWWAVRDDLNVMFVWFEDMKTNLKREIRKVAKFLCKDVCDDVVNSLAEMTSFGKMKDKISDHINLTPHFDSSVSPFMRKGQVGDWKNYFTVAQNEWFDQMYHEKMKGSGMAFDFGDGKVFS